MKTSTAARIDLVLTSNSLPDATARAALRDAYLAQFNDDDAIDIYLSVWERIADVRGIADARAMFDAVMLSLPQSKRSDAYPDGECAAA